MTIDKEKLRASAIDWGHHPMEITGDDMQALLDEIDRLERKNARQSESIREYQDLAMGGDVSLGMLKADLRVTAGERDQLKADNDALRKDAERYRWLRDGAGYCDTRDIPGMAPARMDAFIDAAMGKESNHD